MVRLNKKGVPDFFRRMLFDNVGLKIFSITAAIALFSLVRGSEDGSGETELRKTFFVDILSTVPPTGAGRILVSEVPPRVRVTLQGPSFVLGTIRREDLETVQIDLTDTNSRYFYFDSQDFPVPTGVTVVEISPDSIPLVWAERVLRRLPVTVQRAGELATGLQLARMTVQPERVRVSGAQNEIDPLSSVQTEPVDLTALRPGEHTLQVRLGRLPPHVSFDDTSMVEVTIEVIHEVEERHLEHLRVEAIGPSGEVRPSHVDVYLSGPPRVVQALDGDRVIPFVDARDPSLVGTAPAAVQLRGVPEELTVTRIDPSEVLLTVPNR
jgi:YbbR domain-containing protein